MSDISQYAKERYSSEEMQSTDWSPERLSITKKWLPSTGKILEVGVWDGSIISHYRPQFQGEICGLDISMEAMEKALPLLAEAKSCDLNRDPIPWEEATFDAVVCNEVIEHLVDTDRLLEELFRVIKPGGRLILSTPNLASLLNRIFILFGLQPLGSELSLRRSNFGNPFRQPLRPSGHLRHYTLRALREQLVERGFQIEKLAGAPVTNKRGIRPIEKWAGHLCPSLASDLIAICRRPADSQSSPPRCAGEDTPR